MSKNRDRSTSMPAQPWEGNVSTMAGDRAIRWLLVMRDFLKKLLVPFGGGGIKRRLLLWGLSLFGIAFSFVVVAGYFYMVRQIRQDAAALQSELDRKSTRLNSSHSQISYA